MAHHPRPHRRRTCALAATLIAGATLAGCAADPVETGVRTGSVTATGVVVAIPPEDDLEGRLTMARTLWEESAIASYSWTMQMACYYCDTPHSGARILEGEVVESFHSSQREEGSPSLRVEDHFDVVQRALDNRHLTALEFDTTTGHLTSFAIDTNPEVSHHDAYFSIALTPIVAEQVPAVQAGDLSESLPCFTGFAVTDPEHTVLLRLHADDALDWAGTALSGQHPDPSAPGLEADLGVVDLRSAQVQWGEDLTNNWCTDLLSEPEPEVTAAWNVVAGQVSFPDGLPPEEESIGVAMTGVLTDVIAIDGEGRFVSLPDLQLTNDAWGFVPG